MIAPRKLQSFTAPVHAVAAAVSSVRSTSNTVANIGIMLVVAADARGALVSLVEFEDALGIRVRDAQIRRTSVNRVGVRCLFIVLLQADLLWSCFLENW